MTLVTIFATLGWIAALWFYKELRDQRDMALYWQRKVVEMGKERRDALFGQISQMNPTAETLAKTDASMDVMPDTNDPISESSKSPWQTDITNRKQMENIVQVDEDDEEPTFINTAAVDNAP